MSTVNKVMLIGNLGKDPELKYMPSGKAVCNFSIATTESWKDDSGNKKENTEWHNICTFGKLAEICGQYLRTGSKVYIEGRLKTRRWEDKEERRQNRTEIIAAEMKMLSDKVE